MAAIGVAEHPHVWLERGGRQECMACEATAPLPEQPEVCRVDGGAHVDVTGPNYVASCLKCGRLAEHVTT